MRAIFLFLLFDNKQKLFIFHIRATIFYYLKKIAASPNNFVGRKLFSKVNTRTINYNSLREQLAVSSGL